ncbi:translocation protein TolB [Oceanococcus atlanticus]|uniref:Translocation protein TolB n=2 Tax=Oceanococcus atlanticus TaxID=1317117 RepID=A0A1Y1SE73_9GAMM|nr:translocation protein TolB [Oceanococcus atlanticus]
MKKKDATWSPDGEYIIFAAADGKDSENFSNYDIWMVSKEGRGLRQLTTNGSLDALPVVSHDQASIYFVSNRGFVEGIWKIPFPF